MHRRNRPARALKVLVTAAIAACAISALSAGSALAAPVPAKWVAPGSITLSGSLTLKLNGANPKTCTITSAPGEAGNASGTYGYFTATSNSIGLSGLVTFTCSGAPGLMFQTSYTAATYDSGYFLTTISQCYGTWGSPYGTWCQDAVKMPFTNAAGGTPGRITLSETKLGYVIGGGGNITATGTLDIKGKSGGAMSLTH